tara:strand:+ start:144 stop:761 length:618 start_codon:yes stop_codon:yes gene_type:complete
MKKLLLILTLFVVGCSDFSKTTREEVKLNSFGNDAVDEDKSKMQSTRPAFIFPEQQKVIQCEEGGKFEEYDSGPDKGKFGPSPTGIYYWYVVKFDEKEIFYTHESFHREQSRAEIINGTLKGTAYDLTYDEEKLYGKSKNPEQYRTGERTILIINRTTLGATHFEEGVLGKIKHAFPYKCKLLSGKELMSSILRQKELFESKRKI